jgi:histidyl-tRNA synthetase
MALRFDLTVPLARYVAMYERDLAFPFRRYQMQRVYRGERAQRGRSREFYQCDIDVIGKDTLDSAYDAELPAIIVQIFTELGIKGFTIHFSNRKVLLGLFRAWGIEDSEQQTLVLREIDKLDKIGKDAVKESLSKLSVPSDKIDRLLELIALRGDKDEMLAALAAIGETDSLFVEGRDELTQMVASLRALSVPEERTRINLAIARGLDYYTGTVYETLIDDHPEFGSVCSGGRYENLASHYTKSRLPGVGLSIGLTRLYEQLAAHNLLPKAKSTVDAMIARVEDMPDSVYLVLAADLRQQGLAIENYMTTATKMDKQFKYADKKGVPFVIVMGPDEMARGVVQVKDLRARAQEEVRRDELAAYLKTRLS